MGRKHAIRELNLKEEKQKLDKLNIIHSIRHKKDLDEAPGAYKDINKVMKNQKDLVKVIIRLEPMAVMKG
jgi:tRNA-splicing ligase RtcB (3'-phosphate/5'-hydroxy nucleic acid ligase)